MTLALEFQPPAPDSIIGNLIANHDEPKRFCHVGIVLDDLRCEAHADFGVRWHVYLPNPNNALVPFDATDEQIETIRRFLILEAGIGYDFGGVLALMKGNIFARPDPERWFCSELAVAAFQTVGWFGGVVPHMATPNYVYRASMGI